MYTLKKSDNIFLKNDACVLVNILILLVGNKDSNFAAFLNNVIGSTQYYTTKSNQENAQRKRKKNCHVI